MNKTRNVPGMYLKILCIVGLAAVGLLMIVIDVAVLKTKVAIVSELMTVFGEDTDGK